MNRIVSIMVVVIGIMFVLPQQVFAQIGASEQMMSHMRFTHSQLSNNIVKLNNCSNQIILQKPSLYLMEWRLKLTI